MSTIPVMGSAVISPEEERQRLDSLRRHIEAGTLPPRPPDTDRVFWYWTGEGWRAHPK